jgi:hypothetical protein
MTTKKHLLTLTGIVEAPPDQVRPLILDVLTTGGDAVDGDTDASTVVTQGGWWYRDETTVTAHERGSLVVRTIFDVAHRMPWAVRFVSRKPLKEAPAAFAARLMDVGDRLGKAAYTLP